VSGRHLTVLMHDRAAGRLSETRGRIRLNYDDTYRTDPAATPLSVSLPLQVPSHPHTAVSAFLWGLLPDSDRVLRDWSRRFHVSAASPVSLLSSPVGADCAGAVQFIPDGWTSDDDGITWLTEADVATRLRGLAADVADWLGTGDRAGHFSLAGAQAKTALRLDPTTRRWGAPQGREATTHILKPGVAGLDGQAINEHLCLAAARTLGLPAATTHVATFEDQVAVVAERFDRVTVDQRVVRVHQEDLCQGLAVHPSEKYQQDGGPSPADIVTLLRRALPARDAAGAVDRFVDALLYNWLIGGTDAHAKNYGLLLAGPQIRLAPLYDVASMLPYEQDPKQLKLAMKVGGEYRFKAITVRNWQKLARELRIDPDRVRARGIELGNAVPDALTDAAGRLADHVDSPLSSRLVDTAAAWSRRCVTALTARPASP
jgi:serine/threonine-protein kinase HipA